MNSWPANPNRPGSIAILGVLVVLGIGVKHFRQSGPQPPLPSNASTTTIKLNRTPGNAPFADRIQKSTDRDPPANGSAIERFVAKESARVGHSDPDPKITYQRLISIAARLRGNDINILRKNAEDGSLENDRRFMSVYLLSLSHNPQATSSLLEIALTPVAPSDPTSFVFAEELMIRTQALEGIAQTDPRHANENLQRYLTKQENSFLADQARRIIGDL